MKLAEALSQRADCQTRLDELKQRLLRVAKVQDGDEPAESPSTLLAEAEHVAAQLTQLIQRINRTNSGTRFDADRSITDALAQRDVLSIRQKLYRELANAATVTQDRYTKSEIKFRSTVDVATLQKEADDLAQAFRELDTRIQSLNWQVDLVD